MRCIFMSTRRPDAYPADVRIGSSLYSIANQTPLATNRRGVVASLRQNGVEHRGRMQYRCEYRSQTSCLHQDAARQSDPRSPLETRSSPSRSHPVMLQMKQHVRPAATALSAIGILALTLMSGSAPVQAQTA